jgi:hypothetical protein
MLKKPTLKTGKYFFKRKGGNPEIYIYHQTLKEFLGEINENGLIPSSSGRRGEYLLEKELKAKLTEDEWRDFDVEDYFDNEEIMGIINYYDNLSKAQGFLEMSFPFHSESIFFYKVKDVKEITDVSLGEVILRVKAKFIKCRCKESNMDISNEIVSTFFGKSQIYLKEHLRRSYRKSIRDLDYTYNEYLTEVFCPCRIKVKYIEVLTHTTEGGKWIPIKDYNRGGNKYEKT